MKKIVLIFLLTVITATPARSKSLKGGELRTRDTFTYGRFEARYKPPAGAGQLASFFTYHEIDGINEWNEIDFEIHGRYTNDVQVTTITPGQVWRNSHQWVDFNTHEDFHDYAFEWTPDYVAWFVDGVEIYRQKGSYIQTLNRDQKIMMNIWSSTAENWTGILDTRILPVFAYYDWVSYAAYTPGAGNTGTDNNFTLQWRDDFDQWDPNRWEKATHTFQGNNVDFLPANVVFQDGKMILCLTDATNTGFTDKNPPWVLWVRALGNSIKLEFSEPVDPETAQQPAKYFIGGITVSAAELQPDQRTVELTVSDIDTTQSYSIAILGVKDRAFEPNVQNGGVTKITLARPLDFPVKINVGGEATTDGYLADQLWSPEKEYGYLDGYADQWSASIDIRKTEEDLIFQSERHEVVEYKIRVPDGRYNVTLMFAENRYDRPNRRLFDVVVEGETVVSRLDLFLLGGRNAAYYLNAENVLVEDGLLDLHFTNLTDYSVLNGIVVKPVETGVRTGAAVPQTPLLLRNYPNPFNPATTFHLQIPESGTVKMALFDLLGREVDVLLDRKLAAGTHTIRFDARHLAAGVYFCRVTAVSTGQSRQTHSKIVLLK